MPNFDVTDSNEKREHDGNKYAFQNSNFQLINLIIKLN